ncbi:hypothetical protein THIAE_05995 [Thiomicrospira aerophila AL3]|uniref:Uncharacterized protein n=1 Tax=Thiomicrospira aerophila AL3 TaxID=717772 RepID=W0DV16_9GAMM|nr:hypothetical protein [Thiomicrospira aerophila]AHF02277.1 hypothetical protein THIAE_05995 [Thiomicrospira aerophila AL3]
MNHDELNLYRRKLDLPFSGIRDAKLMLQIMESKFERVSNDVTDLLEAFKDSFPKNRPVYLHRSSDTAARALKWRLSSSKIYDFSDAAKSFRLVTGEVIELLSQAGMSNDELTMILEFDFKKSHLNYELSYLYAEIGRLKVFIEDFEAWRKTPKLV